MSRSSLDNVNPNISAAGLIHCRQPTRWFFDTNIFGSPSPDLDTANDGTSMTKV